MTNLTNRPLVLLSINLAVLMAGIMLLTGMYVGAGISPAWLVLLVVTTSLLGSLFSLFKRQDRQLFQVIRALANGDNTLGFSAQHPMKHHLEQVKQQMQAARFNAEQKSEFLKALLVHIDLAVIVCDAQGNIIESNPAVAKLLGKSATQLSELNQIGTIVLNAEKNLQSTVQWLYGERLDTLTLQVSIAEIQGQTCKVVTLQSIHELLLNKEQQAYKRLTRVLTHEVANSITPLASIAQTCLGLMPVSLNFMDQENKQDLTLALNTIASRTENLGEFIASFRQISSLAMPNLVPTQLADILSSIAALYQQELTANKITLIIDIQCQQLVMLDSNQIEQVLINLLKNAIEAIRLDASQKTEQALTPGKITVVVGQNNAQQLYVEVADNGFGIAEHVTEMVFVPFFTTKQQGSGIGLSLSRQIMVNHGGDLVCVTREQGACFRCLFG